MPFYIEGFDNTRKSLDDPYQRRYALQEIAEWVKNTCLFFGASPVTAYRVAAIYIEGLERDLQAEDERLAQLPP